METAIGIIISLIILTLLGYVMIKRIKQNKWNWKSFDTAITLIVVALAATVIYQLLN